jgi:hypothetical protein
MGFMIDQKDSLARASYCFVGFLDRRNVADIAKIRGDDDGIEIARTRRLTVWSKAFAAVAN